MIIIFQNLDLRQVVLGHIQACDHNVAGNHRVRKIAPLVRELFDLLPQVVLDEELVDLLGVQVCVLAAELVCLSVRVHTARHPFPLLRWHRVLAGVPVLSCRNLVLESVGHPTSRENTRIFDLLDPGVAAIIMAAVVDADKIL